MEALKLADQIVGLAQQAGEQIMQIYQQDFSVYEKEDKSPLTEADLAAHQHIVAGLKAISDLPILSEESASIDWQQRQQWHQYWLVDPLDGTKEFIKQNGEFTVNIALIDQGEPVMGVVYAPALQQSYLGIKGEGAWKIDQGQRRAIKSKPHQAGESWQVVGSRSHQSPEIRAFLDALPGETQLVAMGSSLKLCLVAEGKAHLYPRLDPTSEWDTAAAQAVVEAAGGSVSIISASDFTLQTDRPPLRYNQKDSVLNPFFLVSYQ
jgi:3'(2'), 5'-bisphosphate nucleotidase